jgi:aerobic carbon-monoxide dehydrogenase medium subunit
MYETTYHRASSVDEAAAMFAKGKEAKYLAGGQTLIPVMKQRLASPSDVIDLAKIKDMVGVAATGNGVEIKGATTHHDVADNDAVKKAIPALAHLASLIGDPAVRYRGTIGGSLANNDPAADYPAAVLGLNATVVTDRREIAADDFFQGLFATALEPGEIIVRLSFPIPKRAAYEKFAHPASGYAMTGSFVADTAAGIRVAITGAGPGVFRWTDAEAALAKSMTPDAVEKLTVAADDLNEDIHGTREYRANLVKVMTKRAVAQIAGRK